MGNRPRSRSVRMVSPSRTTHRARTCRGGTPDVRLGTPPSSALALALCAVCASARLAAQTIDTIVVVRHNVYDRKRDAPKVVAGVGNALHITTHAWVVRRALLVRPGDGYDSAKVGEREAARRGAPSFVEVRIAT